MLSPGRPPNSVRSHDYLMSGDSSAGTRFDGMGGVRSAGLVSGLPVNLDRQQHLQHRERSRPPSVRSPASSDGPIGAWSRSTRLGGAREPLEACVLVAAALPGDRANSLAPTVSS